MKQLFLKKQISDADISKEVGKEFEFDQKQYTLIDIDCDVYEKGTGNEIAKFRKTILPKSLLKRIEYFQEVKHKVSTNRGAAAGGKVKQYNNFTLSAIVNSVVLGYIDNQHWEPCRETAFTREFHEQYLNSLPFLQKLDRLYKQLLPRQHALQWEEASKTNFHIPKTSFSTVTINYNFRTHLHKDKANFKKGFALLTVLGENFAGGYLLLPQYKIAFNIRERDLLCLNVNEWHCNSSLQLTKTDGFRISVVCYLREFITKCEMINKYNDLTKGMTQLEIIQKLVESVSEGKVRGKKVLDLIQYTGKYSRGQKPEFKIETKWIDIHFKSSAFYITVKLSNPPIKYESLARAFLDYVPIASNQ